MRSAFPQFVLAASVVFVRPALSANQEACAIASRLAQQAQQNGAPGIDVDVAYACLRSVPVDTAGDTKLLKGLKTMINFQSDLSYIADPPPGWLYPAVDIPGVLDSILSKFQSGGYSCEYDLQLDISNLITSAYDFHLTYSVDIINNVFGWTRSASLVSVSKDGTSLPDIYVAGSDIAALTSKNRSSYTPSPVIKVNNTEVETYINQYAGLTPWSQDPDANYNAVFFNIPRASSEQGGFTSGSFNTGFYHFPGAVTKLEFANGTSSLVPSYAVVNFDLSGVTDGNSLFRKLRSVETASSSSSASASASAFPSSSATGSNGTILSSASDIASSSFAAASSVTTNNLYSPLASASPIPALPNYPPPILMSPDNAIAAYFPEGRKDLAVVALPTFGPLNDYIFQNKFRTFLATAKAKDKTKLIIDVRGNGGGNVNDGYSLFKELFPSKVPYAASNMAAWPLFNAMGKVSSTLDTNIGVSNNGILAQFFVEFDLTVKNTDYQSWSDFYGPVQNHGGEYTNLRRYNFSALQNVLYQPIYGYLNDTNPQPPTFQPDNIVILSDAFCGSTCTIFVELMKTQAGVQAVTVGGRKQYCPMQTVGGSKGSNDQSVEFLAGSALHAYQYANASQRTLFAPYTSLQENANALLSRVQTGMNINFQNNIRKGDESVTPLMFVYEASNCRFFYTAQMLADQSLVWEYTYNLQWGNGTCIQYSTGQPSAQTGFDTSYFDSPPPACAKNFFGASWEWSYPSPSKPPTASTTSSVPHISSTGGAMTLRNVGAGGYSFIAIVFGFLF